MLLSNRTRRCVWAAVIAAAVGGSTAFAQTVDLPEKKLAGAEGLLARAQYPLAAQEFAEFLRLYPEDPRVARAQYGQALCDYNDNDPAAATLLLDKTIAQKDFPKRDEALALLASIHLSQSKPDAALAALDTLVKDYPHSPQLESAGVNRAQALLRLNRFADSLTAVRDLLNQFPKSPLRASALYVAALDQRGLGDDAAAATILRDITANYPNSPFVYDAQLLLGETLAGQGKFDEAVAHYQKLQADAPESRKPAVLFGLAMALSQAGRYPEAMRSFESLWTTYRSSPLAGPAHLQFAIAEVKGGDRGHARELLAAVGKNFPALANSAAYWAARCDILDAKFEPAKTLLQKLAAAKTDQLPDVQFDLAYCELMLSQDDAALKELEAFRAANPRSPHTAEALYYEATAFHRLGKFDKAIEFCDAVLTYPRITVARQTTLLKGESLLMLAQYQKADALFASLEKDSATEPERLRLALRRGQCAYFSADYKTAEARLAPVAADPASARDPVLQEAAFYLGDAQLQQGENQSAAATLKTYLAANDSRSDEASFKLALAQIGAKDAAAGTQTLRSVMKGDPESPWVQRAWYQYAQLSSDAGNHDQAAAALDKLLAAKPAEAIAAPAAYLMAKVDMDTGKNDQAAARLQQLLHDYPKNPLAPDALFVRGIALKDAKKPAEAQRQFALYLQTYPTGKNAAEARHLAAVCMAAQGKTSDAIKALADLAARRDTKNDGVLYDLAWAYRTAGDDKHAAETYHSLLQDYPTAARASAARVELPELLFADKHYKEAADLLVSALADPRLESRLRSLAQYRLGYCYARLNDPAKAAAAFDAFMKSNPADPLDPDALSESGAAYAQLGKLDEAQARQSKVLKDFPNTPAAKIALLRLGETQNQAADYQAAEQTFTRWLKEYPTDPLAPRAHFGRGWSLENRAQLPQARDAYNKVIALDNGITAARAQFQIGETYFAQKQYDTAAKELLKVDILYQAPEWNARALYEAARAFEQLHETKKAAQQYRDCLQKYPNADIAPMAKKRLESLGN